jgi:hypothetical protein
MQLLVQRIGAIRWSWLSLSLSSRRINWIWEYTFPHVPNKVRWNFFPQSLQSSEDVARGVFPPTPTPPPNHQSLPSGAAAVIEYYFSFLD